MKIRNLIVHPVLFAVYPVLFYYSHNIDQVPFESAVRPLATSLAAALLGWWLLQIFTRDWRRAGAITSLVILLFFFYGHARSFLNAPVSTYLLPTLWILILLLGAFAIVRSKSRFANGTLILNAASTVMLAVVLMNIGIFQVRSEARMLDWR